MSAHPDEQPIENSALESSEINAKSHGTTPPAREPDSTCSIREPSAAPAGDPVVPGYEILGRLGEGGMGVVYKARHIVLNRIVALKMILSGEHARQEDQDRFRFEAEAVARLQHPNIIQIHEIGECAGRPYIALEFVEGGTLAQRLKAGPLAPTTAARLVRAAAQAMHLAHSRNIVHRDLKPANILLTADDVPKITDFGLARRMESDDGRTPTGAILGTPAYMAPEQACGRSSEVGPPADVYALGAILYECLTGRPPFKGATVMETIRQALTDDPQPPRRLRPGLPRDLETICLKSLRKLPERRYASAEALAEDLRRWEACEPIQARRVGVLERNVKWVRRHATAAALAAVAALAAAAGVGGWLWTSRDRADRLAKADYAADAALSAADAAVNQARAVERAADEKGQEEPEAPETAKQASALWRQAEGSVNEAERDLATALGVDAARARTAPQRQAIEAESKRADRETDLLAGLDAA
ncbi:MAG TPA: serine/threonine-protein kinase, partial [Gemmataceae bacterium]|nr:serine/threonine-protein kinase [Gemmataceae bacterium]